MDAPLVYADFLNADARGRVRLTCVGTREDLSRQGIELRDGLALRLYSDDGDDAGKPDNLLTDGVVTYSDEDACWVATIDWANIRHAADVPRHPGPSIPSIRLGDPLPTVGVRP